MSLVRNYIRSHCEPHFPMGNFIFLSYAHDDKQRMNRVKSYLEAAGFETWTDENLVPGDPSWQRTIERKIKTCGCVIVLLTTKASNSDWVRNEISYAENQHKRVFPILAQGKPENVIPAALINAQYTDIRRNGNYNKFDIEMPKLVQALREHLQQHAAEDWSHLTNDELYVKSVELAKLSRMISISALRKQLGIPERRAKAMITRMEKEGLIPPYANDHKPRKYIGS